MARKGPQLMTKNSNDFSKQMAVRTAIVIRHNMYIYTSRYTLTTLAILLKPQVALSRRMMSYIYVANASLAIGWFQPLPESHTFAIISSPITLILKPGPSNSVHHDGWNPSKNANAKCLQW